MIPEKIRKYRQEWGYSIEDLAVFLGIHIYEMRDIENGNVKLDPVLADRLGDLFHVPACEFIEGSDPDDEHDDEEWVRIPRK